MGPPTAGDLLGRLILGQAVLLGALGAQPQFEAVPIPVETYGPHSFAAGDIDADGDVDLVWYGNQPSTLRLSLNDGHGVFTRDDSRLPLGLYPPLILADVDGDGDPDVLASFGSATVIALNDGTGYFGLSGTSLPWIRHVTVADFDRDGTPDLAVSGAPGIYGTEFWRGTGGARFTPIAQTIHGYQPYSLRPADLNGDGSPDLVVGPPGWGVIDALVNLGGWRFVQAGQIVSQPSLWNPFEVADVDRDGDVDVLSIAYIRSSLWFNDGTGRFTEDPSALPAPVAYSEDAAFADVDEDGDLDLFVGNLFQPDQLYLNDGRGRFTEVTWTRLVPPIWDAHQVAAADVDGDGDVDLIAANFPAPATLYRNHLRDASFRGPVRIGTTATLRLTARRGFANAPQPAVAALSTRALQQPVAIPSLGRWWLDVRDLIFLPAVTIPAPAGEVSVPITVPPSNWLVGQTVTAQAVIAHGADPATWRLTNVGRATIR